MQIKTDERTFVQHEPLLQINAWCKRFYRDKKLSQPVLINYMDESMNLYKIGVCQEGIMVYTRYSFIVPKTVRYCDILLLATQDFSKLKISQYSDYAYIGLLQSSPVKRSIINDWAEIKRKLICKVKKSYTFNN